MSPRGGAPRRGCARVEVVVAVVPETAENVDSPAELRVSTGSVSDRTREKAMSERERVCAVWYFARRAPYKFGV